MSLRNPCYDPIAQYPLPCVEVLHLALSGVYNFFLQGEVIPQCSMDLSPEYAVVSSSISFFLPCCVMIAIYSRLYHYAKKHVRSIKVRKTPDRLSEPTAELVSRRKKRFKPTRRSLNSFQKLFSCHAWFACVKYIKFCWYIPKKYHCRYRSAIF